MKWIQRACTVTNDGGISKGYSLLRGRWYPSYPETTGYTIPTLLNAVVWNRSLELEGLAISLADYLLVNSTPERGVTHWASSEAGPIVFDTGQVIFGWLAAYDASADERYLRAAIHAGEWLVSAQAPSGAWEKYQHLGVQKVIDTRVAWALLELHKRTGRGMFRQAAICNLEWAVQQQKKNGWFNHCSFIDGEDPFTHTIAYTAEGLLESGNLLNNMSFVESGQLTADAIFACQHSDGSLASTYDSMWRATSHTSCLTGICQVGRLWLRLFQMSGSQAYFDAAKKAVQFVARTQNLKIADANIRGAIAGSYPIYGRYERFNYPNWAAKFFIDALLALTAVDNCMHLLPYVG